MAYQINGNQITRDGEPIAAINPDGALICEQTSFMLAIARFLKSEGRRNPDGTFIYVEMKDERGEMRDEITSSRGGTSTVRSTARNAGSAVVPPEVCRSRRAAADPSPVGDGCRLLGETASAALPVMESLSQVIRAMEQIAGTKCPPMSPSFGDMDERVWLWIEGHADACRQVLSFAKLALKNHIINKLEEI